MRAARSCSARTVARQPIHSPAEVRVRVAQFTMLATTIIAVSLAAGVWGYHVFLRLGWLDALLNASMILTGMGPVADATTDAAKLFASVYALYSGAIFPAATALVLYPIVHRMLNLLHLARDQDD